jgi:hypothetical protein
MTITTIATAAATLNVPASTQNNNCVQDAAWRLRDALKLAAHFYKDEDAAPDYVLTAAAGLKSWVDFALSRKEGC